ncbi:MAG: DUF5605 domain-containing protein [Clostridiales bacterium]|jgi:hypothetical protein|nr:DUF5605 domain-containing protein [Clostridiales bacterium]
MNAIEKWDVFEVEAKGFSDKNPFVDYYIKGVFSSKSESVEVDGFYDSNGTYRVRFMPSFAEKYQYRIFGSFSEETLSGSFEATAPTEGNHGPVRVANQFHLAYEDGKPYNSVGTTCYAWTHQPEKRQLETLEELKKGYFNKIRFCVFPKHYLFNLRDPVTFPYEGVPTDASKLNEENFFSAMFATDNSWDFTRFNPVHFQNIEKRIKDLQVLGIQADIIVMHPYDRWGFSRMDQASDDLYWKYVIARFAAYRNVWWSLANEYDLMGSKTLFDWERYASILVEKDPYKRLRSIHNCTQFYDYTRPWVTHCSMQRTDLHKTAEFTGDWRTRFGKPVILDEIAYEGNINQCWGNISGQELTRRFWEASVRGGYAGHGETYYNPENVLWWSHGGKLHGSSPERIKFLHSILEETPGYGLKQLQIQGFGGTFSWDDVVGVPEDFKCAGTYFLIYFGIFRPSFRDYFFDESTEYEIEVIDTWDMTILSLGKKNGRIHIDLPGKEYMAIRIRKAV